MYQNRALFLIAASAMTISLLANNITFATPVMASSKRGGGEGPVTQEQVNTGNSNFNKEINRFYGCISKTHQDPPSIEKVDNCYYQTLGESGSIGGSTTSNAAGNSQTSTSASPTSTSHTHHKHGLSGSSGDGTTT